MQLRENDKYFYDPVAAELPIKWIERYLVHYEERFAGLPFILLDWQKQIIRDLFGWKHRATGLRRFKECYIEIAKGAGKSPFITAIALYQFYYDQSRGKQIYSIATDFEQAKITFEMAKNMIEASPLLSSKVEIIDRVIRYAARKSKWAIQSGTAEGKHGFRPDVIVADEIHEWSNRKLYDSISANLIKRQEPLMLMATNAGSNRQSICYEIHQRAERVLQGTSSEETLYACIFAASPKDDWSKEQTWKKANPSLGYTLTVDGLRAEWIKASENPALEARFRRLNLSQWIQGSDKWLDMEQWDKCVGKPEEDLTALPCHLGIDLSVNDDLSSVCALFVGKSLYVKSWTFVPRLSARKYEELDSIPFTQWAEERYIRLLKQETVDDAALDRIEKLILKLKAKYKVKTVGYDRTKANLLISRLEKSGLICIPVSQTIYSLSPASQELERRLKAQTIKLPFNPCLRWQASNVEIIADNNGLIRPVKEAQKGKYAGRKGCKIDAIVALIIAISETLKAPKDTVDSQLAQWSGNMELIGAASPIAKGIKATKRQ